MAAQRIIVYEDKDANKLLDSIDDVLTVLGGTDISPTKDRSIYDIAYKGTAMILMLDLDQNTKIYQQTNRNITGGVQLIGFENNAFYKQVYNALTDLKK